MAANATPRQVRGVDRLALKDPIHQRLRAQGAFTPRPDGEARPPTRAPVASTFMRGKVIAIARALQAGTWAPDPAAQAQLAATRESARARWRATAELLRDQGEGELAAQAQAFAAQLPAAQTDQALLARGLVASLARLRGRGREGP